MQIDPQIRFLLSVPDWQPAEASPFQGFAISLCHKTGILRAIQRLPSDILELTPAWHSVRISRRMSGQAPISWYGQSPRALKFAPWPAHMPFTILVLGENEDPREYKEWLASSGDAITLVAANGGHLTYGHLTVEHLQSRFLEVCDLLKAMPDLEGVDAAKVAIQSWQPLAARSAPYTVGGHGTIAPNVAALVSCGFFGLGEKPFTQIHEGDGPYVDQIVRTTESIFDERAYHKKVLQDYIYPRQPDLNIFQPATYDLRAAVKFKPDLPKEERRDLQTVLQIIERQSGYGFKLTTEGQVRALTGVTPGSLRDGSAKPGTNLLMRIRQLEVWLATEAVACLASSEISSVIRPPNRLNLTRGVVRQFSQLYRADRPQASKRAEMFRSVQQALSSGIPEELRRLIPRSTSGIRVIADAHLEWLDMDGIPLGLRYNVSRIPVTPGNLFIEILSSQPFTLLKPESFRNILVLSALPDTDRIAGIFKAAFDVFEEQWRDTLKIKFVAVTCEQELVDALNAFDGALVVFDGHGSHKPDDPAVLWVGKEPVNVWNLRGKVHRPPPIILLSACDTHAADRNHATVANGFLALGTRAVLGSVFPLHAVHAALFAARLLYRVAAYVPSAIKQFERSISWLEVVSGMLRMQASTDILRHLQGIGLLKEIDFERFHLLANRLNNGDSDDPFRDLQDYLIEYGIPEDRLAQEVHAAIAASSTISYLHLGRPETILINTEENLSQLLDVAAFANGSRRSIDSL